MFDLFISDLTIDHCDEVMFRLVQQEWQADELGLMRVKWFDYRYLHPTIATYTYAQAYEIVFRRMMRTHLGRSGRPFKVFDLMRMDRPTASGLWRGRMTADALGMPYEVFIDRAMDMRLSYWKRDAMPRPTQLYAPSIVERMDQAWREIQAGRLHYGAHPEFKVARFVDSEPQRAHRQWLFDQARQRSSPGALMRRFYDEDLITFEAAVAGLGSLADGYFASPVA